MGDQLKFSDFEKACSSDPRELHRPDYESLTQDQKILINIVADLIKHTIAMDLIPAAEAAAPIELLGKLLRQISTEKGTK